MTTERIQKALSRAGFGSRRAIERWIAQGRIQVNGELARLGDQVKRTDRILIDGKYCNHKTAAQKSRVIMYHKPLGEVCTRSDPEGRKTVFQALPPLPEGRWISIGRLDINTTGLLLFTNDGELAHGLMHPSREVQREYAVRVLGRVSPVALKKLTHGVKLDDGMARFEHVMESGGEGANRWFHVVVVQGRNHVVRRLFESQELVVNRLKRVRFGPVFLPKSLRQSAWMELSVAELKQLTMAADLTPSREEA